MDARMRREIELGSTCLAGSSVLVCAFVLSAGIHPPLYAIVTVALLGGILVDGIRYYRENAVVTREDVRAAGAFRPARSVVVVSRPDRGPRANGPTVLGG
jgi:hypothetical protein